MRVLLSHQILLGEDLQIALAINIASPFAVTYAQVINISHSHCSGI